MTKITAVAPVESDRARFVAVAAVADARAQANAFSDYRSRKAHNTLMRHGADADAFSVFLARLKIRRSPDQLLTDPAAWRGVTHGIVRAFVEQQIGLGFAIKTVNARLSTVRTYAGLAAQAGAIPAAELTLIRTVRGYRRSEARHIDNRRQTVRVGTKKALANVLSPDAIATLAAASAGASGARNALIICILADHGLRVSELCSLTRECISHDGKQMTFYREKVDLTQTHRLTARTRARLTAYLAYLPADQPAPGSAPLFRGLTRAGVPGVHALTRSAVFRIVQAAGRSIGVPNLSPHDLRHSWASIAAQNGTPIDKLTSGGGWSSAATPLAVYVRPSAIANDGVLLDPKTP